MFFCQKDAAFIFMAGEPENLFFLPSFWQNELTSEVFFFLSLLGVAENFQPPLVYKFIFVLIMSLTFKICHANKQLRVQRNNRFLLSDWSICSLISTLITPSSFDQTKHKLNLNSLLWRSQYFWSKQVMCRTWQTLFRKRKSRRICHFLFSGSSPRQTHYISFVF